MKYNFVSHKIIYDSLELTIHLTLFLPFKLLPFYLLNYSCV